MDTMTTVLPASTAIGKRYQIQNVLGEGAMSAVFRASDLLTGQDVALKRVASSTDDLKHASESDVTNFEIALMREFRILASLRHPNIVSVLDFGFDEQRQPYFTMSLLENARSILQAGQDQSLQIQADLIIQLLQALAYLHRRHILHRDLKPGNVLVVANRVKVLDFGLSLIATQSMDDAMDTTVGTLAYMAPEIVQGEPPSQETDLYAVGMLFYELLSGRYPYDQSNIAHLLDQILNAPIYDIDAIGVNSELVLVLERLLSKVRQDRYSDANEVIRDVSAAVGLPYADEPTEIRESFLQSAEFVGRDSELELLSDKLDDAIAGQGSAWLVGGESGVGKTRLADELRTLALVRGTLVFRGQAARNGGSPYLLWRDIVRWLLLITDVDEFRASVLKPMVPGIAALLGREIPDAPVLEPADAQIRLFSVFADILRNQSEPAAIILEDLQWASAESLALLAWILRLVHGRSLLIIANYRDDERPELPEQLSEMQVLKLERLTRTDTAALSESMLGAAGRDEPLLNLLWHETEGNPFFLVEVVRALAEEVGHLDEVGTTPLPTSVLTVGLEQLINRRLNRIPKEYLPLLQVAAAAGRRLDLRVLGDVDPYMDLDLWLAVCADSAVLEAQEERWQFAHDKLREGLLATLPEEKRRELHRLVATSIEKVYPDARDQAANLVYHWQMAGDRSKEAHYAFVAGTQALHSGANQEAANFLERALILDESSDVELSNVERARLERRLGQAYLGLGQLVESQRYLEQMLISSGWPVPGGRAQVATGLLRQVLTQIAHRILPSRYVGSAGSEEAAVLLEATRAYQHLAEIYYYASEKALLLNAGLNALNLSERAGPSPELARAYGNMAIIMGVIPQERMAEAYGRWSLETAQQTGDLPALAWALLTSGTYALGRGDWERVYDKTEQAIDIYRRIGDQRLLGLSYGVLNLAPYHQGQFARSANLYQEWFTIASDAHNIQQQALALLGQAECALRLGRPEETIELGQAAFASLKMDQEEVVDPATRFRLHAVLAAAYWRVGELQPAEQAVDSALALEKHIASPSRNTVFDGLSNTAQVYLYLWESSYAASSQFAEAAEQSASLLSKYGRVFPSMGPRACLCQGLFEWLSGNEKKALEVWAKGLAAAKELEMPYEQALAHLEIGRHAAGAERKAHLDKALELFARLDTPYELTKAQAAIAENG